MQGAQTWNSQASIWSPRLFGAFGMTSVLYVIPTECYSLVCAVFAVCEFSSIAHMTLWYCLCVYVKETIQLVPFSLWRCIVF